LSASKIPMGVLQSPCDGGQPATVPEDDDPEKVMSLVIPNQGNFVRRPRPRRVVSYHEVMDALDDESQRITRELGKMVVGSKGKEERKSDEVFPATQSRVLPELTQQSRRASCYTYLPPASTLLDPLPISKEKEAVLSQTRPSWLPPKKKAEERRHLAEYQKMVQQAEEAGISTSSVSLSW